LVRFGGFFGLQAGGGAAQQELRPPEVADNGKLGRLLFGLQ